MSRNVQSAPGGVRYKDHIYPSVSRIIGAAGLSEPIVAWKIDQAVQKVRSSMLKLQQGSITQQQFNRNTAKQELASIGDREKVKHQTTGQLNHSMTEAFAHGDSEAIEEYRRTIPAQVNALERFLGDTGAVIVACEVWGFNDSDDYCCRLDLILDIHGRRLLTELKKSGQIYPEHRMQTAAQLHSEFLLIGDLEEDLVVDGCAVLHMKDGVCHLQDLNITQDDYEAFMHCRGLYDWKVDNGFIKGRGRRNA